MIEEEMPSEEDERDFYAAIGRAITNWSSFEELIFSITHLILGCSKERAAIVFFQHPTLNGRITLTNNLVRSYLPSHEPGEDPDPRVTRWDEIKKGAIDLLPFRNDLAHHSVSPIVDINEKDEITIRHASHKIYPAQLRTKDRSPNIHSLEDVRSHTLAVSRMVNDLRNFHRQEVRSSP